MRRHPLIQTLFSEKKNRINFLSLADWSSLGRLLLFCWIFGDGDPLFLVSNNHNDNNDNYNM